MPIDWFPLWLSLRVALAATALGIAVGVAIAYLLANRDFRGKEALDAAVTLPLVLPPPVFTWKAAVAAAFLHSFPLLVKSSRAALENIDRSYERAARTLGASEWKLFWRVTLPLARRPIYAASALAFAQALGDFGATLMVAGNIPGRTQTMALAIYDAVESGNGLAARVLVLVISAIALVILTFANRLAPAIVKSR